MRLGIDFGTCNSSAALYLDEHFTLVKDGASQSYSLPSSVYALENGELVVGNMADHRGSKDPANYRQQIKREMNAGTTPILLRQRSYQIRELITAILAKLKQDADNILKSRGLAPLTGAVVTIPAEYQDYKREIMHDAAVAAGFHADEVSFLDEPFAAALYYTQQGDIRDGEILLVYDLGGGTFDTALLQRIDGNYDLLALPDGSYVMPARVDCGGTDFDRLIYADLVRRNPTAAPLLNGRRTDRLALLARTTVMQQCKALKGRLSYLLDDEITQPFAEYEVTYRLTREELIHMIEPLVNKTIECCFRMLRDAHVDKKCIDRVVLVGGSCRIPFIQETIKQHLQRPFFSVDDPELAVCQGAALSAAALDAPPPLPLCEEPILQQAQQRRIPSIYEVGGDPWSL